MARTEYYNDPRAPKPNSIVPAVTVFVLDAQERVLLIRRTDNGLWAVPGGAQDFGEHIAETAVRETKEETGVDITNVRALGFTNDVFEESGQHYITLWMAGEFKSGAATVAAPYEASEVAWVAWDVLPEPLFLPLWNLIRGKSYPPDIGIYR